MAEEQKLLRLKRGNIRKRSSRSTERNIIKILGDNPVFLWALPIIGTCCAICFDVGYLDFYDIPEIYAEVNLYTVEYGLISLILLYGSFHILISLYSALSQSDSVLIRGLASPSNYLLPMILAFFLWFTDHSMWWVIAWYGLGTTITYLTAFTGDKTKSYIERLEINLNEDWAKSKSESTKPEKTSTFLLFHKKTNGFIMFVGILFFIAILIVRLGYISAKNSEIYLVAGKENTFAIPRNGDIYILKNFDPKTNTINHEFEIAKSDDGIKLSEEMPPKNLISARWAKANAEESKRNPLW